MMKCVVRLLKAECGETGDEGCSETGDEVCGEC